MSDALYLKAPAIIQIGGTLTGGSVTNGVLSGATYSGGTTFSTTSDIAVNQSTPNAAIPSQLGGPLGFFTTGKEDTITFTPHGVMGVAGANLSALTPLVALGVGQKVFSDSPIQIIDANGNVYQWANAAITGQPTVDLNIDAPTVFGQVTIKCLHAKGGAYAGGFWNGREAGTFPSYAFLPLARFSAFAQLSWFKDRTTGAAQATGTLTVSTGASATFADGDTVTIGSTVYRFKTTIAQAYDVAIGSTGSVAAAFTNLKAAVNGTGTVGTQYYTGTAPHPTAAAGTIATTTLAFNADIYGTSGNSIATTKSSSVAAWGSATLTGGTDAQAASNAVAYSAASPSDRGWYQLLSSVGIRITPRATLKPEANAQYGTIGNYTVTDTGADVEFIPIDLTDYAWNQAVAVVIGALLNKGDVVVTANGGSGYNFKAVISQAMFAGGTRSFSAATLSQGPVKLTSTLCQSGGILVPQLVMTVS